MKLYGKLNLIEQMELKNLASREYAIQSLITRLIREQEEFNEYRHKWFVKVREKYRVPPHKNISITDEHYIQEEKGEET